MKRIICICLAAVLLISCLIAGSPTAYAAQKTTESRSIAIVFDNSGSMYDHDTAWCRAIYAMEVFASMLNQGDSLYIYPMWPITTGGQEYTMENPLCLTDPGQSSLIRDIYTEFAGTTPVESVDAAVAGMKTVNADKKYVIVLTDGAEFYQHGVAWSRTETKNQLEKRFEEHAGEDLTMMYMGIGQGVAEPKPDIENPEYFASKIAYQSAEVLSCLTELCNLVFGRDTLPDKNISGNKVTFDISMNKLIVFVQGENVSDVKLTGPSGPVGNKVSEATTHYTEKGTASYSDYVQYVDYSLQGMMVTYTDCAAGEYTLEYSGDATSVDIYYEPAADLDFVFTDANGNDVDPNALYAGDYKVRFGMKDAKTGELISSELLGNPHYEGEYILNGNAKKISQDGYSGEVDVTLEAGDTFDAHLTATYLSGYSISKDATDFGWPEGGITVAARPAGELRLEIFGGEVVYPLSELSDSAPYTAKVYYENELLTGDELKNVELKWEPDTSNAELKQEWDGDHYNITLHPKDPAAPENTKCGKCTVTIYAVYTPKGSSETQAECTLTYNIEDDFSALKANVYSQQDYIVISDLDNSQPLIVELKFGGTLLTEAEFAATKLDVDCGGIQYTVTPQPKDSTYLIQLQATEGIGEGKYPVHVTATYTDAIGRSTQTEDETTVTLSNVPLWLRWLIILLVLLILFLIIWAILHIKVLPTKANTTKKLSSMVFDGDTVTQATNFAVEIRKDQLKVQSKYAGRNFGVSMDVKPGKDSYLYKSQKRRSAEVKVASLRKFGPAKIQEVLVGSTKYVINEDNGKLVPALPNQKPFTLKHGMMVKYSGTIQDAGIDKDFEVTTKLNFKKR